MLKKDKKLLESLANKYGVSTLKEEIDLGQHMSSAERKSIYRNNSRTRDEEMIYSEIKRLRRAMLNATSQEEEDRYSMEIDRLKRELDNPYNNINESNERYWLGIKDVRMIWHGEWSDPELEYDGKRCNLYDVEEGMYSYMKERIADGEDWGNPDNEEDFRNFCRAHADSVKSDIIDLYDAMHEEEENTLTEDELDEWWGYLGFEEMEVATGYDFNDFDPEDGYQEFIDVCDEWWGELSYEEKKGVYSEVER